MFIPLETALVSLKASVWLAVHFSVPYSVLASGIDIHYAWRGEGKEGKRRWKSNENYHIVFRGGMCLVCSPSARTSLFTPALLHIKQARLSCVILRNRSEDERRGLISRLLFPSSSNTTFTRCSIGVDRCGLNHKFVIDRKLFLAH